MFSVSKVYGYAFIFISFIFFQWDIHEFRDFKFVFKGEVDLLKLGLLFKKRICSSRSKFCPLRIDPSEERRKNKIVRIPSPEVYTFTLIDK